jgi:hypothetical protein
MRARARIALALMALCASFGLVGCASIEELKEAFLRWVESEKLPPAGRGPFADELPDAIPVIPPEKPSKKEASKPSKRVKSARKTQLPHTVVVLPPEKPPIPAKAARPEGAEKQSAPSPSEPPQLPSRWPKAPPPGRFSR